MEKININPKKLYEGSIQAAIVHAVTVGEYPELNYEHSWDGFNYCLNDSQGCRATITFHPECIVAVFQNVARIDMAKSFEDYFDGASKRIIEVAKEEALQYVLEDMNGTIQPVITATFWGTWAELFSNQTLDEIFDKGGYIIKNQLLDYKEALKQWDDYYELDENQKELIHSLFNRKLKNADEQIVLSENETKGLYGDIDECRESLGELNIVV